MDRLRRLEAAGLEGPRSAGWPPKAAGDPAGANRLGYSELHARSAFSMLDGASTPEALARQAADLGLETLALTDLDDLGGAVRFTEACEEHGVRPILGAEVTLAPGGTVVLLCEDAAGWASLCQLVTRARATNPRGLPAVDLDLLSSHADGLVCLSGGRASVLDHLERSTGAEDAWRHAALLSEMFPRRFYVEVADHQLAEDVRRIRDRLEIARRLGVPWLVAGDVRHARARDKPVHDALLCLQHQTTLPEAGDLLFPNDARRLRSPGDVAHIWHAAPAGVLRTLEVAERCRFHLRQLRPSLPRFPLPPGVDDADAFLEARVREGMRTRYPHATAAHERQIRRELDLVRRLGLAGYFLIVWDVVRFARSRNILVQGRGSAANSAVCYCLGITAVDPIGLGLLFERFLSEGRTEAPDIDLDIAHRDREEVLQYVYERYDREHAAMVCNVVTWRSRSAVRDAARVLGLPAEVGDRLARQVGSAVPHDGPAAGTREAADVLVREGIARAGLDPADGRMRALVRLLRGMEGLPRHRSIHVGGFVLTGEPLSTVVPIEPASMQDRTVIQWDKDDLGPVGLVKIDLLGLGMLTLLADALELVADHRGEHLDLASLPADDGPTYEMIRRCDTVGVFQVESRAQMSTLPRTRPERFYDLVVQVALVRPGPIQGDMVHPYLRRRNGLEPVSYLHPSLEPVLARTLGVPLFQEQGMKVAVVTAGFSPAKADELRRAMGSKRSRQRMARLSLELLQGMEERGVAAETAERIVAQLSAFASYGFPESHAASFALLVYASAYLKRHYAPEFYAAILNAQPMGFYPVGSLVADARRHRVEVRPVDILRSRWNATLEPAARGPHPLALRLGVRLVRGLGPKAREAIDSLERGPLPRTIAEVASRTGLPRRALERLARSGAFDGLGVADRRHALWEVLRVARPPAGPLAPHGDPEPIQPPLAGLTEAEATHQDYVTTGASARHHPMEHLRAWLAEEGIPPLGALRRSPEGPIRVAGLVNSRQRPATAKGFVFLSLEDETGMVNVIVSPRLFDRERDVVVDNPALLVHGTLERRHGVVNVKASHFEPLRPPPGASSARSHDFH